MKQSGSNLQKLAIASAIALTTLSFEAGNLFTPVLSEDTDKAPATPSASDIDALLDSAGPKVDKNKRAGQTPDSKSSTPDSTPAAGAPTATSDTSSSSSSSPSASSYPATPESSSSEPTAGTEADSMPATTQGAESTFDEPTSSKNTAAADLNNTAVEAILKKDFKRAVPLLEQALALDPGYQKAKENLKAALYNLGMETYDRHEYAKALPLLQKASRLIESLGGRPDGDLQAVMSYCQRHVQDSSP